MAQFTPAFLDLVLERSDLVRLIDARVPLKKKGKDYWACCPFHQEKTPSFSVSADKQIYYCFGCHAHGNAIGFLMEYERLSFPEAVTLLAEDAGLALPEEQGKGPAVDTLKPLHQGLERAVALYRQALRDNAEARNYLQTRGVLAAAIERFELGFAPAAAQFLTRNLGKSGEDRRLLAAAGLVSTRNDGTVYDRFRERVIFPIRDGRGRLVGLGGRSMDGREPKYLNSPETPIYHKSRVLYGLHQAREGIRRTGKALLVEGYLDVITLHQAGIDNAVAASGTALGNEQLELIFRAAPEIVLCFDGDSAGEQAAWRAVNLAPEHLRQGRLLRVLFLPQGEDPDSLVRGQGAAAFHALLATARPALDVYLEGLQKRHNIMVEDEKAVFLHHARALLQRLADPILKELYEQRVATLCGLRMARHPSPPLHQEASRPRQRGQPSLLDRALLLLLQVPQAPAWQQVEAALLPFLFASDPAAKNFAQALDILRDTTHLDTHGLLSRIADPDQAAAWYRLAMTPLESTGTSVNEELRQREISDCVARINRRSRAERALFIGRAADQAGLAALSDSEIAELLRHRWRDDENRS